MCLFPKQNFDIKGIAFKKGVEQFDCGQCPECLQKKSRLWALRCCAESYTNKACMITLTYDNFVRNEKGEIIGETQPDTRRLSKEDCQKFIKRLRRHFDYEKIKKLNLKKLPINEARKSFDKISYLLTAEHGKNTGRSHYHAILFGVDFVDKFFYKKSKRGNRIYRSNTLEKLWKHGICTIDAVNVNGKVARYCTKYCAKDQRGIDDTFMLVSRNIGDKWLMDNFNGKSYFIDGLEYTIPRQIWNKYIAFAYRNNYVYNRYLTSSKYVSLRTCVDKYGDEFGFDFFQFFNKARERFRNFRDSNNLYKRYIEYWKKKSELYESTRPNVYQRIMSLPNNKYFMYKQACLEYFTSRNPFRLPSGLSRIYYARLLKEKYNVHLPEKSLVIKGQMTQNQQNRIHDNLYYIRKYDKFIGLKPIGLFVEEVF